MRCWRLADVMRARRVRCASHLATPLEEHGITLSRCQLSRIVNGNFSAIRLDVLEALCAILECSPADLLHFEGTRRPLKVRGPAVGHFHGALRAEPKARLEVRPVGVRIRGA
jgi:DNA-binding Xre family transcriptional regulator